MKVISPTYWLAQVAEKTTLIHGTCDTVVSCQISRDMAKQYPAMRYVEMPDMEHGFRDVQDKKAMGNLSQANRLSIYNTILKNSV